MADGQLGTALRHIRSLFDGPAVEEESDAQLLARFTARHEEAAFEALVRRHGPMVGSVCRRVLGSGPDAEDAFQATFLLLARKAGSIRRRESVAGWLYAVAYRTAARARADAARRRSHERRHPQPPAQEPGFEAAWRELRQVLDEELARLPEKYRSAVLLCYLQGLTHEEAARRLGCAPGTVKSRLARGRERLRFRLVRRGLELPAATFAVVLAANTASALVPSRLVQAATRAALGVGGPAGGVSVRAAALADAVGRGLLLARWKVTALVLLALVTGGIGAGWLLGVRSPVAGVPGPAPQTPAAPAEKPDPAAPRTDRQGDPLPPNALRRLGTLRLRQKGSVAGVTFAPRGKLLASAAEDGVIHLWDPGTGKELRSFGGHKGRLVSLAFSPDGRRLASVGSNMIHLWDAATGKELRAIPNRITTRISGGISWLADVPLVFSPDGKRLAAVAADHSIHLWDIATGKESFQAPGQKQPVRCLFFSPDQKVLKAASGRFSDCTVRSWDLATGKELDKVMIPVPRGKYLTPFAISPDGKTLALEGREQAREKRGNSTIVYTAYSVRLWDLARGKERFRLDPQPDVIWAIAFSPDRRRVAAAGMDNRVGVWDTATGKLLLRLQGPPESARPDGITTLTFAPDGKSLALAGSGSVIHVWDLATGRPAQGGGEGHEAAVTRLAFAPDGRTLASAGSDRTVRLWDPATGRQRLCLRGHRGSVRALVYSPDGKVLASASAEGDIRLWDAAAGKQLRAIQAVERTAGVYFGLWPLAFTPDDKALVSWGDDRRLRLWDVATGKLLWNRPVHLSGQPTVTTGRPEKFPDFTDRILDMQFSADGRTAALATPQGVFLVKVATGQELARLKGPTSVYQLAFSPDGKMLLAAGWDETAFLWEVDTGKELFRIPGLGKVNALAFAPDGRSMACASGWAGGKIHLLDAITGKRLQEMRGHDAYVGALAFSPDGKTLASGQRDTTVLLWDIRPGLRRRERPAQPLGPRDLDRLWTDLAGADAPRAHAALWTLARSPRGVVEFLKGRLRPVPRTDAQRIQRLIADLDARQFAVRRAAFRALQKLGAEAEPALRKTLDSTPSVEVRKRVTALLAGPPPLPELSPEVLRRLRAIRVLEQIGSKDAVLVLKGLAEGAPAAPETQDARSALKRLAHR